MQLLDFGAIMNSAQAGMPDYAADQARKELMGLQRQQLAMQVQKAQQQLAKEQSFQADLEQVLINPTDDALARLIMKHPDFAQEIKSAHGVLDESRRRDDLRQMGEIYSAAKNGRYDLAATSLERRIEADRAVDGTADPVDEAMLAALKSGDPVQQKAAMGQIGIMLSAITGPDKFGATLGTLNPNYEQSNGIVWDKNTGNVVGQLPGAGIRTVDGVGIFNVGIDGVPVLGANGPQQSEGGGPASPGGMQLPGPIKGYGGGTFNLDGSVATPVDRYGFEAIDGGFVAPQEGGYSASDGASGAPVNFGINQKANPDIDVRSLTPEAAQRIRYERYWVPSGADELSGQLQAIHYDTAINMGVGAAKSILQQSGGDPAKYMSIREARHRKMRGPQDVWARRNAELRQFAGLGGAIQVKSKQQYDRLPKGTQYVAPDGSVRVKN